MTATSFESLAGLYAIGVVGAITVNLGSCTFNRVIGFTGTIGCSFGRHFCHSIFSVEITLALIRSRTPSSLSFVSCWAVSPFAPTRKNGKA